MLYSVYSKKVNNLIDEQDPNKYWAKLLNNVSMETVDNIMSDLASAVEIDINDYVITILPDVYDGEMVLNTVTQETGTVYNVIDPQYINVTNINNMRDGINQYAKRWNVKDVIVLNKTCP